MDRRGFLGALALAPAAVAACSTGAAAGKAGKLGAPEAPGGRSPPAPAGLGALRAFGLPAEAEPAFTFRAASARTGGP